MLLVVGMLQVVLPERLLHWLSAGVLCAFGLYKLIRSRQAASGSQGAAGRGPVTARGGERVAAAGLRGLRTYLHASPC